MFEYIFFLIHGIVILIMAIIDINRMFNQGQISKIPFFLESCKEKIIELVYCSTCITVKKDPTHGAKCSYVLSFFFAHMAPPSYETQLQGDKGHKFHIFLIPLKYRTDASHQKWYQLAMKGHGNNLGQKLFFQFYCFQCIMQ